jgi:hypothetical protein
MFPNWLSFLLLALASIAAAVGAAPDFLVALAATNLAATNLAATNLAAAQLAVVGFSAGLLSVLAFANLAAATCSAPEPTVRICYNKTGATPQNITLGDISYMAEYLRFTASQDSSSEFYTMSLPAADNCTEWQVTTRGSTWLMAKLVGNAAASVTFDDLANSIDGGVGADNATKAAALYGCDTAGGQMGVVVDADDARYQQAQFTNGTFTNEGIVVKLVRNPDAA